PQLWLAALDPRPMRPRRSRTTGTDVGRLVPWSHLDRHSIRKHTAAAHPALERMAGSSDARRPGTRPDSAHIEQRRDSEMNGRPNIVLVHGAWADGSSWTGVIERLQEAGYRVRAPQFPLTPLADDVARL